MRKKRLETLIRSLMGDLTENSLVEAQNNEWPVVLCFIRTKNKEGG
jgi:hypothetical protein